MCIMFANVHYLCRFFFKYFGKDNDWGLYLTLPPLSRPDPSHEARPLFLYHLLRLLSQGWVLRTGANTVATNTRRNPYALQVSNPKEKVHADAKQYIICVYDILHRVHCISINCQFTNKQLKSNLSHLRPFPSYKTPRKKFS